MNLRLSSNMFWRYFIPKFHMKTNYNGNTNRLPSSTLENGIFAQLTNKLFCSHSFSSQPKFTNQSTPEHTVSFTKKAAHDPDELKNKKPDYEASQNNEPPYSVEHLGPCTQNPNSIDKNGSVLKAKPTFYTHNEENEINHFSKLNSTSTQKFQSFKLKNQSSDQSIANSQIGPSERTSKALSSDKISYNISSDPSMGPLDTFINLGFASKSNSYKEVVEMHRETLKIQLLSWPVISNEVAQGYLDLAFIEHQNSELLDAKKHYEKALSIYKKLALDKPSPNTANCLSYLGVIHRDTGNLELAEKYLTESLEMKQSLYEGYHPNLIDTLNNLAVCYHIKGEFSKASEFYEDAIRILFTSMSGKVNNPYMALLHYNLGSCYIKLNQIERAKSSLKQGYSISKVTFGEDSDTSKKIAALYQSLGSTL